MQRALWLVGLLTACGGTDVHLQLHDTLADGPAVGIELSLVATDQAPFRCQQFSGTTDASGRLTLRDTCLSRTGYRVAATDPALWLDGQTELAAAGEPNLALSALVAPEGRGSWRVSGGSASPLPIHAEVHSAQLRGSDERVDYPSLIPADDDVPLLAAGDWLVLTSDTPIGVVPLVPLLPSDTRHLRHRGGDLTLQPWWYLGVRFTSDTDLTRQAFVLDTTGIVRRDEPGRSALAVPSTALPRGRYALLAADGRRLTVLDATSHPDSP